ncbi:MAG: hypothetical protein K1X89_14175 [Myxococcaceae bacterium]|nr:hypothetical protein [Myxococcaceae bacterium]
MSPTSPPSPAARPGWHPLVVAALLFTLTSGSLTGAFDLWSLRVASHPVPLDHHRGHGLSQLFGFWWLFLAGLSMHLAPRFFGAPAPGTAALRRLRWTAIPAVLLAVVGRLGALVPHSRWLGLAGAVLLLVATVDWGAQVLRCHRASAAPADALRTFCLAGTAWWVVASASFFWWQLGQSLGGPAEGASLETVWAPAMLGGAGSWLWGIFQRPGVATLGLARPSPLQVQASFWTWQLAALAATFSAWSGGSWEEALSGALFAVAAATLLGTLRPWASQGLAPTGALQPRAMQAGLAFVAVSGALRARAALGALGIDAPVLVQDAARHAFSLGGGTLLLFGFAGRMVPGFSGVPLRWPRLYDAGVLGVMLGTALRLSELLPSPWGPTLAGASAGVAYAGVAMVGVVLLGTLRQRPA